ncbi:MAG: BREX system P-loop protein BrxC, partial [Catalinimonas sp.]
MTNREIYVTDPSTRPLANDGVAKVSEDTTDVARQVLRYELETFVCEGQYAAGLIRMLETYLKNVGNKDQPTVWVSGFYGSGKSHLVKMLRSLWADAPFADGATPRGLAHLPREVLDLLKELDTLGKRYGGLHACSGTLGSASSDKSVRLALLSIVFRSLGLPQKYHLARFVLWLQKEDLLTPVREYLQTHDYDWDEELANFHVAEGLYAALCELRPAQFSAEHASTEIMTRLYPEVNDVSNEDMVRTLKRALGRDGALPLTLVVLDEVQMYVGENNARAESLQEAVETCSKELEGRVLFVGTGQSAINSTSYLKKLEGRFTVRVELSDADVDSVVRKVILAKRPEAKPQIEAVMEGHSGEVARHLAGSQIGHRPEDTGVFAADYPLLPTRRRFWEKALRVLDQTGTDNQLRNQLSMVHKAAQSNLDAPLGHVIPADFLYFDSAEKLLQAHLLPMEVYTQINTWRTGNDDQQLVARACGVIFALGRLARENQELGLRPTPETIADLLVDDLKAGSGRLRARLPELLDGCELLIRVEDEYRLRTKESARWQESYEAESTRLRNEPYLLEEERYDRLKKRLAATLGRLALPHGNAKVERALVLHFDPAPPPDRERQVCLWARHGWDSTPQQVTDDARRAGHDDPTIYLFVPGRGRDELNRQLIGQKAARATLDKLGTPNTPDGKEARAAMETREAAATARIDRLLDECLAEVRVFQGGGQEVAGSDPRAMTLEAAERSLQRLYPDFEVADHPGWEKVYERARKGSSDLKAVGHGGDVTEH